MQEKKNKVAKVLIPLAMVLVVVGIWFFQNQAEQAVQAEQAAVDSGAFPLNVVSVDVEKLAEHKMPIIVDFGADKCIPCIEMAPVLVKVNKAMQNKAIIQFVDVWKSPSAAEGFPVQIIPTQVFITAEGKPYVPSKELSESMGIEFLMYANKETKEHIFTAHQGGLTEAQMLAILADMGVK